MSRILDSSIGTIEYWFLLRKSTHTNTISFPIMTIMSSTHENNIHPVSSLCQSSSLLLSSSRHIYTLGSYLRTGMVCAWTSSNRRWRVAFTYLSLEVPKARAQRVDYFFRL